MKHTFLFIVLISVFFVQNGYAQNKEYKTLEQYIEKNKAEYGRKQNFKVLFIVDSVNFYSEAEFNDLKLKNFDIEKKYYNSKNEIVNLIIIIRTKEND